MGIRKLYKRFKHWMDYQPPGSMTSRGWDLFDKEFKEKAPVRFWIRKNIEREIFWKIKRKYRKSIEFISVRTFNRYHYLPTGAGPGYMSDGDRMINANFGLLVNYVERHLARAMYFSNNDKTFKERYIPFYLDIFPIVSEELGMKHLEWESKLDDPSLPIHERSDRQAQNAREIIELYNWWKHIRPSRKLLEMPDYDDQGLGMLAVTNVNFNRNAPDYKDFVSIRKKNEELEDKWSKEDTDMLVRLVKIRDNLSW